MRENEIKKNSDHEKIEEKIFISSKNLRNDSFI